MESVNKIFLKITPPYPIVWAALARCRVGVEPLTEPGLGGSGRLGAGGVPPMGGPFEEQGHADETVVDNLGQAHKTEAHAQAWKNVCVRL